MASGISAMSDARLRDREADGPDHGSPLARPEPWDLVADAYAAYQAPAGEGIASAALDLADLPPGAEVIDVATGPGTLALVAARRGAIVSALDFSPAMIRSLRRRAAEAELEVADVRVGDGQQLPWPDERFDGAFSLAGLIFFPDRAAGFRELRRVLRPGRRAVVSSTAALPAELITVMDTIGQALPDLPLRGGKMPLAERDEFAAEMAAAGFREVTIETIDHAESFPSMDEFWKRAQHSAAPLALLQRRLSSEAWQDLSETIVRRLDLEFGSDAVVTRYRVHLGVGLR